MDRISSLSRLGYASCLPRNTQEMVKETQRSIAISLALIEKAKKKIKINFFNLLKYKKIILII